MGCGNCETCSCGLTGGLAPGDGMAAFLAATGADAFAADIDDLLLELAAARVTLDPTEPLDVWERKVLAKYAELKNGVQDT